MEQIIVTKLDGSTFKLQSRETGSNIKRCTQTVELLGVDVVDITVESTNKMLFSIGDKITIIGRDYTLNTPAREGKSGEHSFVYDLQFEGVQYDLLRCGYHVNIDTSSGLVKDISGDTVTGNIKVFLDILIANANRVFPGKWVLGTYPTDTEARTESFGDQDTCLSVLQTLCGEEKFNTEFSISINESGVRTLNIGATGTTHTYTFEYGKGKGIYDLSRQKVSSTNIITRLNAYGSTRNISTVDYRAARLCLPAKSKALSYLESPLGITAYGLWEATKNFDEIYPHRTGTVSALGDSALDSPELVFIDSSMDFDLNELKPDEESTKYLIPGISAKIHFNTGALAGYEFEVTDYDHDLKQFALKPITDENGYTFPSATSAAFQIAIGDKYKILDIYMPQSYVDAAELELQAAAQAWLDKYSLPKVSYTLTLDWMYLKNVVGAQVESNIIWAGDYIPIKDLDLEVDKTIRVKAFTRDLMQDYAYTLTIADLSISVNTITRIVSGLKGMEQVIKSSGFTDPAKVRRLWENLKARNEILAMVFDTEGHYYSDKIAPLSIDTTMLAVGAKSMHFSMDGVVFDPNYAGNKNRVVYSGGTLTHYAVLDDTDPENPIPRVWNITGGDVVLSTDAAYYMYARCARETAGASILFSTDKITVEQDPNNYHFLIGIINSVDANQARALAYMYGFTTVNGRYIKTGRITSNDGNTYFDLDAGEFRGTFKFGTGVNVETAVSTAQNTAATANYNASLAQTTADNAASAASSAQSTANSAYNNAQSALNQIYNITADNVLSMAEKPGERSRWNDALNEKSGINSQANAFGITTENANYNTAFQELANYLNGGSTWSSGAPLWLSDVNLASDTYITGSTYRSMWNTLYNQRQTLLNAIAAKAKTLADTAQTTANTANTTANSAATAAANAATAASNAQTSANSAIASITNIVSDNVLSAAEKPAQRQEWNAIQAEYSRNNTQALAFGITTEKVVYQTAFQDLANYLNAGTTFVSGIPSWLSDANLATDTSIVGSTYRSMWVTYYSARTDLLNAIATKAKAIADAASSTASAAQTAANNAASSATSALNQINDITSDNVLSAAEKPSQRQAWDVILAERAGIQSQSDAFGGSRGSYDAAFTALANYLNAGSTWVSGTPSWISDANLGTNTTIVGSTYRTMWKNFYDARTSLLNQLSAIIKGLSDQANSTAGAASTAAQTALTAANAAKTITDNFTTISGGVTTGNIMQVGSEAAGVVAGMTGVGTGSTQIRFWAGASHANRATAPFRVAQDGSVVMSNAQVSGVVNANSGTIGGFTISSGRIGVTYDSQGLSLLGSLIKFSNDSDATWAGIGENVLPASSGLVAVGRFENKKAQGYYTNQVTYDYYYSEAEWQAAGSPTPADYHYEWNGYEDVLVYIMVTVTTPVWVTYSGSINYGVFATVEGAEKNIAFEATKGLIKATSGGVVSWDTGYVGTAYTDIIENWIDRTNSYVFTVVGSSLLTVRLPAKSFVTAKSSFDVTFLLYITVSALVSSNSIRLTSVTLGQLKDNAGNNISYIDMSKGDTVILRYHNGYYYRHGILL